MISEQRVRYIIEQLGTDVAAKQQKEYARSILESDKAVNQLSNDLKANARMAEVYARQAERSAAATKSLQTATAGTSASFSNLAQNASRTAQGLGVFGNAAQGLIPGLEGMGAAVGRASGLIQSMTGLLGGPVGIAAGVAAAGMGVFALATKDATEKLEAFNKEVEESNELANEAFFARMGKSNAIATAAAAAAAQAARDRVGLQSVGLPVARDDIAAGLEGVDREIAIMTAAGLGPGPNIEGGRGGPAPFNPTHGDRLAEAESLLKQLQAAADEAKRQRSFGEGFAGGVGKGGEAGDKVRTQLEREFSIKNAARERERSDVLSQHEMELRLYDEKEKRVQAFHGAVRDGAHETWSMVGGAAANAFAAMARGEKVSLKAILQSLGSQAIAAGTMKLFEAAFAALTLNPAAAGMAGVGAAQIAFGATLAGAGSGGGGAAGAGAAGGGRGSLAPPTPTFVQPSRETGGRAQTIIINNNPSIIQPTAQDGKQVQRAEFERMLQGR